MLPPLLVTFGISVIIQNGLLQAFGAYTHRLQQGAIETASLQLPGGISVGVYPLLVFAVAVAGDRLVCSFCSTARVSAAPSAPRPTMPTPPS